jgi:hypothetical protein
MARTRFSGPVASDNGFEGDVVGDLTGDVIASRIQLDISSPGSDGVGVITWNPVDQTINVGLDTDVTMQVGQEQYFLSKNQSGSDIPNGTIVQADGAVGNSGRIKIVPAQASTLVPPIYVMGVTTENIVDGSDGFVTEFGLVRGLDTRGGAENWEDGDILYVSGTTPGAFTKIPPTAPVPSIVVAMVLKASNNGSIFVRPTFGETLDQLHNVTISTPQNGDVLKYNSSTGVWYNAAP